MFTLITMLGGMVKSSTQTAWWAILFRLLIMCVILILVCSSVVLEIGPIAAASSKLLRSSASISIHLVPLRIWLACATILCTILLRCASLIAISLKLMLTVLRSLASVSWYKPSKLSVSALTIIRSATSSLTWGIVVIIVRIFISISFICLLGFWWVLSLFLRFSFRFTSASGLFWFCAFKQLRYFTLFFVHRMCYMGIIPVLLNLLPSLALLE